jgi:hypothetical protein
MEFAMLKPQVSLIAAVAVLVAGFAIGGSAIAQTAPTHATSAPAYRPVQTNVAPQIRYPTTTPAVIDDLLGREPDRMDLDLASNQPEGESAFALCCNSFGCYPVDFVGECGPDTIIVVQCTPEMPSCEPRPWPDD